MTQNNWGTSPFWDNVATLGYQAWTLLQTNAHVLSITTFKLESLAIKTSKWSSYGGACNCISQHVCSLSQLTMTGYMNRRHSTTAAAWKLYFKINFVLSYLKVWELLATWKLSNGHATSNTWHTANWPWHDLFGRSHENDIYLRGLSL